MINLKEMIILCIITFIIGIITTSYVDDIKWQKIIVENNCGHYNSTTGKFEWNKK